MTAPFYIASSRVVFDGRLGPAVLQIQDGRITSVEPDLPIAPDAQVQNFGNLVIFPGLIDVHAHVNEPGRTEWEGFETATRAAAAGGITTLVDMPLNSSPVTTSADALRQKLEAAGGQLHVDCAFHGGLIHGNAHRIGELVEAGVVGLKAFLVHSGIDDFPESREPDLRAAMRYLAGTGVPLLAHAELEIPRPAAPEGSRCHGDWVASHPVEMETTAIRLLGRLADETGAHVHIVHVSSAEAVEVIAELKERGLPISAETCPHYLTFASEEVPDGATAYKCAPPIRSASHREALWQALDSGVLDLIASDHSPSPPDLKCRDTGDFSRAWGGIASLQFLLPAVWTGAAARGVSIPRLASWLAEEPARLIGLDQRKGQIAPGYDADLIVWDPEAEFEVTPEIILHRHKLTPYIGKRLRGRVSATYLRGQLVSAEGTPTDSHLGEIVRRNC